VLAFSGEFAEPITTEVIDSLIADDREAGAARQASKK